MTIAANPMSPLLRADQDERDIIATCLNRPELTTEIRQRIRSTDFFVDLPRQAFQAIEAVTDRGEPSIYTSVVAELIAQTGAAGSYWDTKLLEWLAGLGTTGFAEQQSLNIARAAQRRRLMSAGSEVIWIAQERLYDADAAVKRAQAVLAEVPRTYQRVTTATLSPEDRAKLATERNNLAFEGKLPPALSFGLTDLDNETAGGARPGQLILIGGRTGMGKSSLLQMMARAFAKRGPTLLASNEMDDEQLRNRDLAVLSALPLPVVVAGRWTTEQRKSLRRAEERLADLPVSVYADGSMTSAQLRRRALELAAQIDLAGVVVDYIQRMNDPGDSDLQRVGGTVRSLKSLALELNVPVVAGCQLSRAGATDNPTSRPSLTDLRSSGELEQEADVVFLLYRASYLYPTASDWRKVEKKDEYPGNTAEVIIAKQRQGVSGKTVRVAWLPSVATFASLSNTEETPF